MPLTHSRKTQQTLHKMIANGGCQPQSKLVELFSLRFEPILATISLHLGIAGLQALYQVSKAFYGLKEHLQKRHFNINKRLTNFVAFPDEFRSRLGKHNALISGEFALNFFSIGNRKIPNLDIFIENGTHAVDFTNYIRKEEGYETSMEENVTGQTVSN